MYVALPTPRRMQPARYDEDRLHMYRTLFRDLDPFFGSVCRFHDPRNACTNGRMHRKMILNLHNNSPVHHVVQICLVEEGKLKS